MPIDVWVLWLSIPDAVLGLTAFFLLLRSKTLSIYWPMLPLTLWRLIPYGILLLVRHYRILTPIRAYFLYFCGFWLMYAVAAICSAVLTWTIFHEVLRPLQGLQRLGAIVYRWIGSISVALALAAIMPSVDIYTRVTMAVNQMQRISAVIVLSLMLFVVFTIRPLGLTVRSRLFGVSAGICIIQMCNLLEGYYTSTSDLMSTNALLITLADLLVEVVWIRYFWVEEPKRKFVLLPTTSPFHQWNRISEMLGHDPGYVAIGGVPPEAFASAELEIFQRASTNMARVEDSDAPEGKAKKISANSQRSHD